MYCGSSVGKACGSGQRKKAKIEWCRRVAATPLSQFKSLSVSLARPHTRKPPPTHTYTLTHLCTIHTDSLPQSLLWFSVSLILSLSFTFYMFNLILFYCNLCLTQGTWWSFHTLSVQYTPLLFYQVCYHLTHWQRLPVCVCVSVFGREWKLNFCTGRFHKFTCRSSNVVRQSKPKLCVWKVVTLGGLEHFTPPVISFLFFLMDKNFSQNPGFIFFSWKQELVCEL